MSNNLWCMPCKWRITELLSVFCFNLIDSMYMYIVICNDVCIFTNTWVCDCCVQIFLHIFLSVTFIFNNCTIKLSWWFNFWIMIAWTAITCTLIFNYYYIIKVQYMYYNTVIITNEYNHDSLENHAIYTWMYCITSRQKGGSKHSSFYMHIVQSLDSAMIHVNVHVQCTVEPRLTDTPQRRTPAI